MAVNNMTIEQAYQLIASLHQQATGRQTATPTDLSSFISVAQATLLAGTDNVMNAISQVVGLTLIAVRPYSRKFAGLQVTTEQWGGIIRKLNFLEEDPESNKVYDLTDGTSVDMYTINKPKALQTNYVGSIVWSKHMTIFKDQLKEAFTSPEAFGGFMSGVMTHFSNMREQWLEEMARANLINFIAGKTYIDSVDSDGAVIHLLTEYNAATGLSLTAQTVRQPANYPGFMKWSYGRISDLSKKMTERTELFQKKITDKPIIRHTPLEYQRVYMLTDFLDSMSAEVLADTYHDSFIRYSDVESVNYWQAIDSPDTIEATPVVIDSAGQIATGTAQTLSNIIGVIFDKDAIGYNIYEDNMYTSPFNARGEYYNLWNNVKIQYQNDFTEKGIVLCLD